MFVYLQCSCIFSVRVSSVFVYLQCSCTFSVRVSSVFVYLQCSCIFSVRVSSEANRSWPYSRFFSWRWKIACRSSDFGSLQRSPARGHHESGCHLGRTLCCGYPWPNTREVSLGPKAEQDRQEPSNWCLVNVRLQFMTQCLLCPRHCGLSGRGSFTSVQCHVAPHPLGQLFCASFTKLSWSPLLWSSQGIDFSNHSLLQKEDPEDPLLPLSFVELFFRKIFCFRSSGRQGCLVYPEALHPRGIPKGPRQSRIDRCHPMGV